MQLVLTGAYDLCYRSDHVQEDAQPSTCGCLAMSQHQGQALARKAQARLQDLALRRPELAPSSTSAVLAACVISKHGMESQNKKQHQLGPQNALSLLTARTPR